MMEKITAKQIREYVMPKLIQKGSIVCRESFNFQNPDVLEITNNLRIVEYEIKVSLADLRKELKYIEQVQYDDAHYRTYTQVGYFLDIPLEEHQRRYSEHVPRDGEVKYQKHMAYLFENNKPDHVHVPNRYNFLIPQELYLKEKERIDKLPYGVYDARTFFCLKRAKNLHDNNATTYDVFAVARSTQYRVIVNKSESL